MRILKFASAFSVIMIVSQLLVFSAPKDKEKEKTNEYGLEMSPEAREKWEKHQEKMQEILNREKIYPSPKRPKKISEEELEKSREKSENTVKDSKNSGDPKEYEKKTRSVFKYGLEDEITSVVDEINKNEDKRFTEELYDLFYKTKSVVVREKILDYFGKLKDPCLEDFVCEVINDPYDQKKSTVSACFTYASAVKCTDALPGLVELIDKEDEDFFNGALSCMGEIGGTEEALFLEDYLDRDDMTTAQRQSLMRVLGKINAVETWEKLADIAQDEDENTFVRSYAAQAIGEMKKEESVDILLDLFESEDPNLRIYVLKGLKNYDEERVQETILQAIRDSNVKVRLEAVSIVDEQELKDAVPFLVYRCKASDEEKNLKEKAYSAIARLNTEEGNEYLVGEIKNKKTSDTVKQKISAALLKYNHAGTDEIIELAKESLKSDLTKNLRYALGKEFAKYGRPEFQEICSLYLEHADVSTVGTGLDIFAAGKYRYLRSKVKAIADDDDETAQKWNEAKDLELNGPKDEKGQYKSKVPIYFKKKTANPNSKKAKRILTFIDSVGSSGQDVVNTDAETGSAPVLEK